MATPFDSLKAAVAEGNQSRVAALLNAEDLDLNDDEDIINVLRATKPSDEEIRTAILQAIPEPARCFESVLVQKFNTVKSRARDKIEIEERWRLTAERLVHEYPDFAPKVVGDRVEPVWEGGNALHLAATYWSPTVLRLLLQEIGRREQDESVRTRIVCSRTEEGATPLIKAITKGDLASTRVLLKAVPELLDSVWLDSHDTPLHTAVQHYIESKMSSAWSPKQGRADIIHLIIETDPSILCRHNEGETGGPAYRLVLDKLSVLPQTPQNREEREELQHFEQVLRDSIFQTFEDVEDIKQALYRRTDKSKLLDLDLSDFDYRLPAEQICDFAQFVSSFKPSRRLQFESTLARVRLPDMSHALHRQAHTAVSDLLETLVTAEPRGFGIKKIVTLTAYDNPTSAIGNKNLQEFVDAFHVHELNWFKYNLDISRFTASDSLRKLWLYSQDNFSQVYYWAGPDGLVTLPRLVEANIRIIDHEGIGLSGTELGRLKNRAEGIFQQTLDQHYPGRDLRLDIDVQAPHTPRVMVKERSKSASERFFGVFEVIHKFLGGREQPSPRLRNPISLPPVRIGIIDNGFDMWRETISANIVEGMSFEEKSLPWFTAAHAHGTQMASLIRKVNPYCELYVYRVHSRQEDVNLENAIKAIHAATSAGVDILNLSWSFDESSLGDSSQNLEFAINAATNAGILVFAAMSDEPLQSEDVFPAAYPSTITVAAANSRGGRSVKSRKTPDLLILGENIAAEGPNYFRNAQEPVSGSSVSTALASGIASILLVYAKCASENPEHWKKFKRKENILRLFRLMRPSENENDRFVDPYVLFGRTFQRGEEAWRFHFNGSSF